MVALNAAALAANYSRLPQLVDYTGFHPNPMVPYPFNLNGAGGTQNDAATLLSSLSGANVDSVNNIRNFPNGNYSAAAAAAAAAFAYGDPLHLAATGNCYNSYNGAAQQPQPNNSNSVYSNGMIDGARRKNATRETTATLKAWLYEHRKNPYPTKGEKIMLAIITKMTLNQVSTWFANARRRLKKENKMVFSPRNRTAEDIDSDSEMRTKRNSSMNTSSINGTHKLSGSTSSDNMNIEDDDDLDDLDDIDGDEDSLSVNSFRENKHANPIELNKEKPRPKIWSLADVATNNTTNNSHKNDFLDKMNFTFNANPAVANYLQILNDNILNNLQGKFSQNQSTNVPPSANPTSVQPEPNQQAAAAVAAVVAAAAAYQQQMPQSLPHNNESSAYQVFYQQQLNNLFNNAANQQSPVKKHKLDNDKTNYIHRHFDQSDSEDDAIDNIRANGEDSDRSRNAKRLKVDVSKSIDDSHRFNSNPVSSQPWSSPNGSEKSAIDKLSQQSPVESTPRTYNDNQTSRCLIFD